MRGLCATILACAWCATFAHPAAAQERPACDPDARARAKQLFDLAEAHKRLDHYKDAARYFQAAFKECARPLIAFNAAQVLWLGGQRDEALVLYEAFIKLSPQGTASDVAREMFFKRAEEFLAEKQSEEAEPLYRLYLKLAPNGKNVKKARIRLRLIDQRPRQARFVADDQDKFRNAGSQDDARRDSRGGGESRTGYRVGFYVTAGLSAAGVGVYILSLLQVRGYERDKDAAREAYHDTTGIQLNPSDVCDDNSVVGATNGLLLDIKAACESGKSTALLGNIFAGATLVTSALAVYLLYKGYLQKPEPGADGRASLIAPLITRDSVGAQLTLRF